MSDRPDPDSPQYHRWQVGLLDASLSGWGRAETGELYKGFSIGAADTVADIGCGMGAYTKFAAELGAHVAFADIDAERVAHTERLVASSKARGIVPLVSDCSPIPLPDGFATRVICTEVLEHVDDENAMMAELVRIGSKGARYLLTVPDAVGERLQKQLAPASHFEPPFHVRVFERETFEELVTRHGLVVDHRQVDGFYWSIYSAMFWSCDVGLGESHPALSHWERCWAALLATKDGPKVKSVLDAFAPNRQLILAHKPD